MEEATTHKEWITELLREHGYVTPMMVREAARPKDSPGHAFVFNVPPGEASELYYLERAHELLRRVKVKVNDPITQEPKVIRFFHAVPGEQVPFMYVSVDTLRQQPDKLAAARAEALRRLKDAQHAVEDYDIIAATVGNPKAGEASKLIRRAREVIAAD